MKLDIYTDADVFAVLKPEWNVLLQGSASNTIFSTWEWQSTWWEAYHPGQLWIITCRDGDGRLVGLAPWFIDEEGIIRGIGCVDVTDYIDVIVAKDCTSEVFCWFAQYLSEQREHYHSFQLCNIPAGSPTLEHFPPLLKQYGFSASIEHMDVCPIIELPETWDGYLSLLDKKQRHEVRRKMRRAYGSGEQIADYTVNGVHNLNDELDYFFNLMAASDPKKAEFLQDEKNLLFFKQLVSVIHEAGWLRLNFLTVNDEPAAAYLNFDYDNKVLVYNSGLAYEPYGHLSPGIVLLANNIRQAIEDGHTVFDFLRGDETYKYRMGGKDTAIYMLTAH